MTKALLVYLSVAPLAVALCVGAATAQVPRKAPLTAPRAAPGAATHVPRAMSGKAGARRSAQKAPRKASAKTPKTAHSTARKGVAAIDKADKAPAPCRVVVDESVTLLKAGIAVLSAEAKKHEDADVDRGVAAFNTWLERARGRFQPLRQRAVTVQSKLDKVAKAACQKYSYRAFHKVLTRFSTVAAFYHSRIAVFRALGDLFR